MSILAPSWLSFSDCMGRHPSTWEPRIQSYLPGSRWYQPKQKMFHVHGKEDLVYNTHNQFADPKDNRPLYFISDPPQLYKTTRKLLVSFRTKWNLTNDSIYAHNKHTVHVYETHGREIKVMWLFMCLHNCTSLCAIPAGYLTEWGSSTLLCIASN